jgi:hypothetical protein
MTNKIFIPLLVLLPSTLAFSQAKPDTLFIGEAKKNLASLYQETIQGQAKLYNGSEYLKPEQTNETHPFFLSDDWVFGSVEYDGETFENVPLLYDITSDKVVTEHFYTSNEMELVIDKLTAFSIPNHLFQKIADPSLPQSGFYDVLYNGPTRTLARRQKKIQETIVSNKIEIDFEEKTRYFILKNNIYYAVKTKASILKVLEDQKSALRQYINKNSLNVRRDRETALSKISEYYDTLKTR